MALELSRLLPTARVYTSFFDGQVFGDRLDEQRVRAWALNGRIDGARFRSLLPLYPFYFSTLDLRQARLVVSSSSAFAKAVRSSRDGFHVAYVHTPMRFAWQMDSYLGGRGWDLPARLGARLIRTPLAAWDRRTARRPDLLVANSEYVRARIRRHWRRDAEVIHPPVDVEEFSPGADQGYLLVAARLLAYRRIDIAIEAANLSGRELVVAGDGPERRHLERLAGPTIRFVGHRPRRELVALMEGCHAYLVPGEEDFGIAVVEAMACGKPVAALARGGATESVIDGVTGVLFGEQSVGGMAGAIERLDETAFDGEAIRRHARLFDRAAFAAAWRRLFERNGVEPRLYAAD